MAITWQSLEHMVFYDTKKMELYRIRANYTISVGAMVLRLDDVAGKKIIKIKK